MALIICPGIHPLEATEALLEQLTFIDHRQRYVFPSHRQPPYSPVHLNQFITECVDDLTQPLTFLAFSAGVVGAIAVARQWQRQGGQVAALIALDAWAVPLDGDFPIHCLSHDALTHWTMQPLWQGNDPHGLRFYANPPVDHLALWRSPQTVKGVCGKKNQGWRQTPHSTTALQVLAGLLS